MSQPPRTFNVTNPRGRVLRFARAMEAVLRQHDRRAGWWQWGYSPAKWLNRLTDERDELLLALRTVLVADTEQGKRGAALVAMKECCDVANFAMMCFDTLVRNQFYPDEADGPEVKSLRGIGPCPDTTP